MISDLSGARAHTNAGSDRVDWLGKHLARVSELARGFAAELGAGEFGAALGALHDIGKVLPAFQDYLDRIEGGEPLVSGPPHAIWGAALWYTLAGQKAWREICLPIAGHHGGLASAAELALRLEEKRRESTAIIEVLRTALASSGLLHGIKLISCTREGAGLEFRVRLLLSVLADADFLATEEHFQPAVAAARSRWPEISDLWPEFEARQEILLREARKCWNVVQEVRAAVYERCLDAAALRPGIFRLTVPTGGGKTRSSLGFALRHAMAHALHRIILAVPYTSITEQSAKVYREVLGEDAVVEHHSSIDGSENGETQTLSAMRARLATENWDATAIVTTTVQLFESLFARRPGKVRKLHNLARSVILLDEVQTLPFELLRPTLDALISLVVDYGSTVVLCTATQPAFEDTPYLRELGGMPVREIVPECACHFNVLRRVRYERRGAALSWTELAADIRRHQQVLVIVNTRRDAMCLLDELKGQDGLLHLSTLLCGAHRGQVLEDICERLSAGLPVRAICTQVVEAGVDLDFPVVYRALGPLDRIVQAAGRCNRSGLLPEQGLVVIFEPADGGMPAGAYRAGFEQARVLLEREPPERLHDPALYHEYFQRVFSYVNLDARKIQSCREHLDYPEVAERYRFMAETVPALVSYKGLDEAWVEQWRYSPSREAWRRLQPYVVNLYKREADSYAASGWLAQAGPGLYRWLGKYDGLRGISAEALDPADLVVSGGSRWPEE
jgi:CRISPR-associated endonuclease/helicase Cas3